METLRPWELNPYDLRDSKMVAYLFQSAIQLLTAVFPYLNFFFLLQQCDSHFNKGLNSFSNGVVRDPRDKPEKLISSCKQILVCLAFA